MSTTEAYLKLLIIIGIVMSMITVLFVYIGKKNGNNILRMLSVLGLSFSIFLIVFLTVLFLPFNFSPEAYNNNLIPFTFLNPDNFKARMIKEVIPNIVLFVPLGFFLPVVFHTMRKFYRISIAVFTVTFSVEFLQYFIGRAADIDDVLLNVLGGMIGYLIYVLIDMIFGNNVYWNTIKGENTYLDSSK